MPDLDGGRTPVGTRPTLQRGARGEAVRTLQRMLALAPDGLFDAATETALRTTQRGAGLVADGVAGPATWDMLARLDAGATLPPPDDDTHRPSVSGQQALGPDGRPFAVAHKLGFFTNGTVSLEQWLAKRVAQPAVSPSLLRLIQAVSVNEGRLDAVNSWDACFLSFGMLQWTAGQEGEPGELATVLAALKRAAPDVFADCFGRYGLDAVAGPRAVTGTLLLDGVPLDSGAKKAPLRNVRWAYRFWRAGQHDAVRLVQFHAAAGRIGRFVDAAAAGRRVREWVSSERGMAHLLDEHTNRPGHVPGTLERGLAALGSPDPAGWSEADEGRLIDAYLAARHARTPSRMTDTVARAGRIEELCRSGALSAKRGSFVA